MTESPKVPSTVEDSHAKLAAEMLQMDEAELPHFVHKWAARVEQLGRQYELWRLTVVDREAREAEIATVKGGIETFVGTVGLSWNERNWLLGLAARLDGGDK